MINKRIIYLLNIILVIFMLFSVFTINSYAENNSNSEIFLYGFGDDYEDESSLTLTNTKICYVDMRNIPFSEKENIKLNIKDEDIAEIQEMTYGDTSNPVITAKIKGKKLGTTDIIANLTYNGVNYTSKITATVRETNYWIHLQREDYLHSNDSSIKKGESLKLVATLVYTTSHIGDISSKGVIWSSNNENVAKVDSNGLVTAIEKGKATITAKYETNEGVTITNSYVIEVINENTDSEEPKIKFYYDEPGPAMTLNYNDKFSIGLENIPKSEKENIKFKIENTNIAKITNIEYDKSWADAIVTVKYLSVGKTKLTAILNYNGKEYTDSYDLDVSDFIATLVLSSKEYSKLPMSLKIGEKLQLNATLKYNRGSLPNEDITYKGITYISSDNNVAKVNETGLITAIGEGTVVITAEYKVDDETTVIAKYNLKIIDSKKSSFISGLTNNIKGTNSSSANRDPTTSLKILPKTGKKFTIMILAIFLAISISFIIYKKYKKI